MPTCQKLQVFDGLRCIDETGNRNFPNFMVEQIILRISSLQNCRPTLIDHDHELTTYMGRIFVIFWCCLYV